MRIALFGGTFDPPHRGHLAIARAAADAFGLDTVFLAPTGRQPLKAEAPVGSFAERLTMTALACGEDARFAVSNLDAPRPDGEPNYTVRTLGLLRTLIPDAEVFALVGADSFQDFARWREPGRLLEMAEWIVVSRPGYTLEKPDDVPWGAEWTKRVHLLDSVHDAVSATGLRAALAAGQPCNGWVPKAVADYIASRGLYRGSHRDR